MQDQLTPETPILAAGQTRFAHACLVIATLRLDKIPARALPLLGSHADHLAAARHAITRARRILQTCLEEHDIPPAILTADSTPIAPAPASLQADQPSIEHSNAVQSPLAN